MNTRLRLAHQHDMTHEANRHAEKLAEAEQIRLESKLSEATFDEQIALKQAELKLKAAETETAAEVAKATVQDRINADRQVIEAETRGRAARAEQLALSSTGADTTAALERLLAAYANYNDSVNDGDKLTFTDWLGNFELRRIVS
jgi:hypothetical protein